MDYSKEITDYKEISFQEYAMLKDPEWVAQSLVKDDGTYYMCFYDHDTKEYYRTKNNLYS